MNRELPNGLISPSRKRRFAIMIYELMLLFGVVFAALLLFDPLTQSDHALKMRGERQLLLFFVIGLYFVWFWKKGGQTLAMKTWHVQLVREDGSPVTWWQAIARYLLCLVFGWGIGMVYSFFDRNGQFPQDRLLRTLLVSSQPKKRGAEQPLRS
ncbi:MAG: RDD family protein [Limnobacter sp.]|nr:RDD family protein [Limnobacter sp.]